MSAQTLRAFYEKAHLKIEQNLDGPTPFQTFILHQIKEKGPFSRIIEWGCGQGGTIAFLLAEKISFTEIIGVDFAETALSKAKRKISRDDVTFIRAEVEDFRSIPDCDFHIDGHLLHCLVDEEVRQKYLKNVYQTLTSGGIFVIESMLETKAAQFSPFHRAIVDKIEQKIAGEWSPVRVIKSAFEIEQEILTAGFKIKYFVVDRNLDYFLSGESEEKGPDVLSGPFEVLRIVATKN